MDHATSNHDAEDLIAPYGAMGVVAAVHPASVFGLIEWTAETIRWLQQENERVTGLEQACRTMLENDRALWLSKLAAARHAAEACFARAVAAESDASDAKTRVRLAATICKETLEREKAAVARAEAAEERARVAEEWRKRISRTLPANVVSLIDR